MTEQQEQFEAWVNTVPALGLNLTKDDLGAYSDLSTYFTWAGWRAASEALKHDLDRALERNTELLKEREWQPIETAPKTGETIWLAGEYTMRLGFWAEGKEHECHGTVDGGWIDQAKAEGMGVRGLTYPATRWQRCPDRLPSPPEG